LIDVVRKVRGSGVGEYF